MNDNVDGFKCRTCGFVAFGENSSTAKYKECLGCGNLMGDDPAVKQTTSSSDVSLLESCNNCKHQFSTRASVCPKCNHERTSGCFVCKKQIAKSSTSCPECGDPSPFELPEKTKQEISSSGYEKTPGGSTFSSKYSKQKSENLVTDSNTSPHKFSLSWFLFSFDGRIGRQSFWCAYPIILFFSLILSVALELVKESRNMNGLFILVILTLLFLWPSLAIQVKRWHDRNKSGNWILINFIPLIGFLWVTIELCFLKGTEGNNVYGTDPLLN
jgi:uncharacterized membrane protein YhaH (DUF805 family)/transcription elongation factor Elf1